jgi:hypothetical protein
MCSAMPAVYRFAQAGIERFFFSQQEKLCLSEKINAEERSSSRTSKTHENQWKTNRGSACSAV